MRMVTTLILLALIGFAAGLLLAKLTKRHRSAPSQSATKLDADTMRRLTQLKNQLESGLITQEEYQQERDILLRE